MNLTLEITATQVGRTGGMSKDLWLVQPFPFCKMFLVGFVGFYTRILLAAISTACLRLWDSFSFHGIKRYKNNNQICYKNTDNTLCNIQHTVKESIIKFKKNQTKLIPKMLGIPLLCEGGVPFESLKLRSILEKDILPKKWKNK